MNFYLIKSGVRVGDAVKLSDELCYYQLWKNIVFTYSCSFAELKKKFKLEVAP